MIRCRGGDFLYSYDELNLMKTDAELLLEVGADGLVFGALTPEGHLDEEACKQIVDIASKKRLPVTLHRAVDVSADIEAAVAAGVRCGFRRVLTSGGAPTAKEGAATIANLHQKFGKADSFDILAGSGVTAENAAEIVRATGVNEIHGSFSEWKDSAMNFRHPLVQADGRLKVTAEKNVAKAVASLRELK